MRKAEIKRWTTSYRGMRETSAEEPELTITLPPDSRCRQMVDYSYTQLFLGLFRKDSARVKVMNVPVLHVRCRGGSVEWQPLRPCYKRLDDALEARRRTLAGEAPDTEGLIPPKHQILAKPFWYWDDMSAEVATLYKITVKSR